MDRETNNIRLLKAAFKEHWGYLSQHGAFKYQLSMDDGTQQSYEDLVKIGTLLLRQKEDGPRQVDPFIHNQNAGRDHRCDRRREN